MFKIHPPSTPKTLKEVWGPLFRYGRIRVAFSQTRGGFAVFVSGRMVGELFETEQQAIEWLKILGVREDRIPNPRQNKHKTQNKNMIANLFFLGSITAAVVVLYCVLTTPNEYNE